MYLQNLVPTRLRKNRPSLQNAIALVLDLDETVVHTNSDIKLLNDLKIASDPKNTDLKHRTFILDFYDDNVDMIFSKSARKKDSKKATKKQHNPIWGLKRPYLDEFVNYCLREPDYLIVLSAGTADYVVRVVDAIFPNRKPDFVFSREHCLKLEDDYVKPLKLLYSHAPILHDLVLPSRMIMVDDKENNFMFNIANGLVIKKFEINFEQELDKILDEMRKDDQYLLAAIKHIENRIKKLRSGFTV